MSFIKEMGDAIGSALRGHVGGNVVQGAQTGKTAQQITAMLNGVVRATGRAPQASDLPQRASQRETQRPPRRSDLPQRQTAGAVPVTIQNNKGWAPQAEKIFPNAPVLKQIAADTARNERFAGRGPGSRMPMGRDTTDPASLRLFSQAGKPPVRPGQSRHDKRVDAVRQGLAKTSALAIPLLTKIAGGIGAAVAVVAVPLGIQRLASSQLESQRHLSRFSGRIAKTMALMEVQNIHLGIRQARATSASTQLLGNATRELRERLQPIHGDFMNVANKLAADAAKSTSWVIDLWRTLGHPPWPHAEGMGRDAEQDRRWGWRWGGHDADPEKDPEGIGFEKFLRLMNPVAQPRNAGVTLGRRGP